MRIKLPVWISCIQSTDHMIMCKIGVNALQAARDYLCMHSGHFRRRFRMVLLFDHRTSKMFFDKVSARYVQSIAAAQQNYRYCSTTIGSRYPLCTQRKHHDLRGGTVAGVDFESPRLPSVATRMIRMIVYVHSLGTRAERDTRAYPRTQSQRINPDQSTDPDVCEGIKDKSGSVYRSKVTQGRCCPRLLALHPPTCPRLPVRLVGRVLSCCPSS
jgi:hypothetical protein